ncbi:MAG: hypothetical protein QG653_549 [Patescibacteria group bacterium]|nr:hypothetical protein [Patescibacteria group bacterium]
MGHSIQELLKKINSAITFLDVLSLAITTLIIIVCSWYIVHTISKNNLPITYVSGAHQNVVVEGDTRPFGSVSGTTYTFSWCQGAGAILPKNKIYFTSEEEAKISGRTLSKLCAR